MQQIIQQDNSLAGIVTGQLTLKPIPKTKYKVYEEAFKFKCVRAYWQVIRNRDYPTKALAQKSIAHTYDVAVGTLASWIKGGRYE